MVFVEAMVDRGRVDDVRAADWCVDWQLGTDTQIFEFGMMVRRAGLCVRESNAVDEVGPFVPIRPFALRMCLVCGVESKFHSYLCNQCQRPPASTSRILQMLDKIGGDMIT